MLERRSAPTLESVAAVAGVSRATAGRVLSGSTTVGDDARTAVLQAADELGYVTNRAARALMTRRSGSVAFVVAEPEERFFADPHFALVLRGAHAAVAEHDVQLVFSIVHGDAERARFERFARCPSSSCSCCWAARSSAASSRAPSRPEKKGIRRCSAFPKASHGAPPPPRTRSRAP
jgi:hypothetical protein